ncbi:hypothetical protein HDU96_001058, partial [Phlyctochytrium bullatum]
ICFTVYPTEALIVEKSILVFYNAGNLLILVFLARHATREALLASSGDILDRPSRSTPLTRDSTTRGPSPQRPVFRSLLWKFLVQDGQTFVLALVLDTAYVGVMAGVKAPWMMSLAAGLANGFNLVVLHVKHCAEVRVILAALIGGREKRARSGGGGGTKGDASLV